MGLRSAKRRRTTHCRVVSPLPWPRLQVERTMKWIQVPRNPPRDAPFHQAFASPEECRYRYQVFKAKQGG